MFARSLMTGLRPTCRVAPRFASSGRGLFGTPITRPGDMPILANGLVALGSEALRLAGRMRGGDPAILPLLDNLSNEICLVGDAIEAIRLLHPKEDFRRAATEATQSLGAYLEVLNTDHTLHAALKQLITGPNFQHLDEEATRAAHNFMHDFEQSGAGSGSDARKGQFRKLSEQAQILSMQFEDATAGPGLPFMFAMPGYAAQQVAPEQVAHLLPLVDHGATRKQLYEAVGCLPEPADALLAELLHTRRQLGLLANCDSFAQKVLQTHMAQTPAAVAEFFALLQTKLSSQLQEDFSEIRDILKLSTNAPIQACDLQFYRRQVEQQLYSSKRGDPGQALRPYLSLGNCTRGLGLICSQVFGVELRESATEPGEVHHPSVKKFIVVDPSTGPLGTIYFDLLARPSKDVRGAAHYTVKTGRFNPDGENQLPVVILQCGVSTASPFVSLEELQTIFHEFGHALHSMFGKTRFQTVAGTRCALDFVELPSTLLEEFARDFDFLSQFAHHKDTQEPLPRDLFSQHQHVTRLFWATDQFHTVTMAVLDQELHGPSPLKTPLLATSKRVQKEIGGFSVPSEAALHARFAHLATYPASYYSYPWCRALAGLVWQALFAGKTNSISADASTLFALRAAGDRYRGELLSRGSGRDPWVMMQRTLGFRPTAADMVDGFMALRRA